MKTRLTILTLMIFFLWGNVQAYAQSSSVSKSHEIKVVSSSILKSYSSEGTLAEDEFTHWPSNVLLNFSTLFVLRAAQRPVAVPSFLHKPTEVFILYRVLRN